MDLLSTVSRHQLPSGRFAARIEAVPDLRLADAESAALHAMTDTNVLSSLRPVG